MRTLRNMLRTHWDVDANTLGTTKIQKNPTLSTLSPRKKKLGPLGGPWWHTSLVGQEFLCLPLLLIIFDLEKKKKTGSLGVHGDTFSLATKNFYAYLNF